MDGILLYDDMQNRFVVQPLVNGVIDDETPPTELHCGACLTLQVKQNEWHETRIEMVNDDPVYGWYFVDVGRAASLIGHSVRIE